MEFGVKLKSTSMIQSTLYFRSTTCLMQEEFLKIKVLDMEFAKLQIEIKKHNLGHIIPKRIQCRVGHATSNIVAFFMEHEKFFE